MRSAPRQTVSVLSQSIREKSVTKHVYCACYCHYRNRNRIRNRNRYRVRIF